MFGNSLSNGVYQGIKMRLKKHTGLFLCACMTAGLARGGIVAVGDDFDTSAGTSVSWMSIGSVNTAIDYDTVSEQDYDDGDPNAKLDYAPGMVQTGDGVKGDGGITLNSLDATEGNEAMGLSLSGFMEEGEVIVFSGSVYNDNSSYSKYTAQLWNLSDNVLLGETPVILVHGYSQPGYVPSDFAVACTGTVSDADDTLQVRIVEENNNTARDIYLDRFSVTNTATRACFFPRTTWRNCRLGV
jgi:hypothetical protein